MIYYTIPFIEFRSDKAEMGGIDEHWTHLHCYEAIPHGDQDQTHASQSKKAERIN